jgi:hypothetical protein
MSNAPLNTVFEYLAVLISERDAGEPFLVKQIMPALQYKFPGFNFAEYSLTSLKEFVQAGEKAGYFKLVITGDPNTAHLLPGSKRQSDMGADDPRRTQWMSLAIENMIIAERADQILDAIKGIDAFSEQFDKFLAAQEHTAPLYSVRGKVVRLRQFIKTLRDQGEAQAVTDWQPSRSVLRLPPAPASSPEASKTQGLIWSLAQGTITLERVQNAEMDSMFFAMLALNRDAMAHERAWDLIAGLQLMERDARKLVVERTPPPPPQKRGLFGGSKPVEAPKPPIDDQQIAVLIQQFRKEMGIRNTIADDLPLWRGYVQAESPVAAMQYIAQYSQLINDDKFMNWLDDEISRSVMAGQTNAVKTLAHRAAVVLAARQHGIQTVQSQPIAVKAVYDELIAGIGVLSRLGEYVRAESVETAVKMLESNLQETPELGDQDSTLDMLNDVLLRAARRGDLAFYRRITDRIDLCRNVIELGAENGIRQHQRYLAIPKDEKTTMAEVGILLLANADDVDDTRSILERYPAVATEKGLGIVKNTMDVLSFRPQDKEVYLRYFSLSRLIERCLQIGIDRAVAELR